MREQFTDTRRFETHGEWCTHLAARGFLKPEHRQCVYLGDHCAVAATEHVREVRRAARNARRNTVLDR